MQTLSTTILDVLYAWYLHVRLVGMLQKINKKTSRYDSDCVSEWIYQLKN